MGYIVGLDSGFYFTKAVLLKEKKICAAAVHDSAAMSANTVAELALSEICSGAGVQLKEIDCIIATGFGKECIKLTDEAVSDTISLVYGARFLIPTVEAVVDAGAHKSLAVGYAHGLKVAKSDKCAGGSGVILEMASEILDVPLAEMNNYIDDGNNFAAQIEINPTCSVFIESEIISLVHNGTAGQEIMRGMYLGLGHRLAALVDEVAGEQDMVGLVGGGALHDYLIKVLERDLQRQLVVPENPLIVNAVGAALYGGKRS